MRIVYCTWHIAYLQYTGVVLIEAIPDIVRPVTNIIPFTFFVEIIRGLLIKHTAFIDLLPAYLSLAAFVVVFVVASIVLFRKTL